MLDAAGYPKGSNGIRTGKDGKPINLRLFARSESQFSQQAIHFLAGWLKDVGIASTIKVVSNDSLTEIIGQGNYDMFQWGWVVEPDPDYQLSTFTCAKRSYKDSGQIYADLSDSFYCNKAYDALYTQQAKTTDPAARAAIVLKMEKILYDDVPYIITDYYDDLEAYRSDRWGNLQQQPPGKGVLVFQYGTYTYRNVEPLSEIASSSPSTSLTTSASTTASSATTSAAPTSSSSGGGGGGSNTGVIVGVIAAVVVLGGGGFLLGRRRGSTGEDDEE
jgi:peptide/nickel transport system substrate-binding protein